MAQRSTYGPVLSRRFGMSLGVDLVPHKVCTYDCVYCQIGPTTDLTTIRRDFLPLDQVLGDIDLALREGPYPEVITLAGSGEPTLYRSLHSLIRGVRELADLPLLLITNGSLLFQDEVAEAAAEADLLAPSLDAGDPGTFERINKPHPSIDFEQMVRGVEDAVRRARGETSLEVMLVAGINDNREQLEVIAGHARRIDPDHVDVNTPVRPVPEREVAPCGRPILEMARSVLGGSARIIAAVRETSPSGTRTGGGGGEHIRHQVARRPSTAGELALGLGVTEEQAAALAEELVAGGELKREERGGLVYYLTK